MRHHDGLDASWTTTHQTPSYAYRLDVYWSPPRRAVLGATAHGYERLFHRGCVASEGGSKHDPLPRTHELQSAPAPIGTTPMAADDDAAPNPLENGAAGSCGAVVPSRGPYYRLPALGNIQRPLQRRRPPLWTRATSADRGPRRRPLGPSPQNQFSNLVWRATPNSAAASPRRPSPPSSRAARRCRPAPRRLSLRRHRGAMGLRKATDH